MRSPFASPAEIETSLRIAGARPADAAAIAARAKPCVWIDTQSGSETDMPLGSTRIGGAPDLPAAMAWPWRSAYPDFKERIAELQAGLNVYNSTDFAAIQAEMLEESRRLMTPEEFEALAAASADIEFGPLDLTDVAGDPELLAIEAPLTFIAQFDLAEIWRAGPVDSDFPREGRLYFFYDTGHSPGGFAPGDREGARLIYDTSPVASLQRKSPPEPLASMKNGAFRAQRCTLHAGWFPPFHSAPELNACRLSETSDEALKIWWNEIASDEDDFRFGGHPTQIQGDMPIQCVLLARGIGVGGNAELDKAILKKAEIEAADWLLVAQIASSSGAGMMWGDMGKLYVWMHREALRSRRFDEARVILQCY